MQVPLVLEELLEDELDEVLAPLDEAEPVLELDELVPVVVPEDELPLLDPPPHPASKAVSPAPPIQARAFRRSTIWLEIVCRSNASPRSWSSLS